MSYLTLKCTKFNFGWSSAPNPTGGAYSAPSDLIDSRDPTFKGNRQNERKEREKGWTPLALLYTAQISDMNAAYN